MRLLVMTCLSEHFRYESQAHRKYNSCYDDLQCYLLSKEQLLDETITNWYAQMMADMVITLRCKPPILILLDMSA